MIKILFIAILFLFNACSTFNSPPPDINLVDLRIKEVRLLETTLVATLKIHNDSNRSFSFDGSSHKIYINGSELGRATSDESITVNKFSSSEYSIPVRIGNISVFRRIQNLIESRNFEYKIDSTLYTGGFGLGRINTSNTGTFSY
jgi:LEA14-like dessication related protein